MKEHRLSNLALSAMAGRGLLGVGICLLVLSLHACKKPTTAKRSDTDGGIRDTSRGAETDKKDAPKAGPADAAPSQACKTEGTPSKGKGERCSCDSECRTGHCANGVCCTSTCTDKCKACSLPSTLGDCDYVPVGAPPIDPTQCAADTPGSCDQNGACDGKGGCQLYVAETICSYGKCDGDGLGGVKVCDGKGNCAGDMSLPCAPYSCNPARNECYSACTGSAQCALGKECKSESCGVKRNGYKCGKNDECASGHCADGYCCSDACNGPCLSCGLDGLYGRCALVPAGHLHRACEKGAETTCGTTGFCNGGGVCGLWPADTTPCKSATCSGTVLLSTTAVCDGKGTCKEPTLVDCSPFLCASGQCNESCKSDDDCKPGHACLPGEGGKPGVCSGKKQLGQPCDQADDCDSGNCVDGVCCESKCEGACRSCALPGSPGRCTSLPAEARDPRRVCADEGAASCGRNGLCDGAGGCQLYPAGTTVCGSPSCDDHNIFTDAPTCNQFSQCVTPPSRGCDPYVCNGNTCLRSCTRDTDCVPPNTCKDNSCGKQPPGAECSSDTECRSGFCAQGVCCNLRCNDACKACNLAGNKGLCIAVADGSPDPQEKCAQSPSASCGTTGACKGGACALFDTSTPCKPPSCGGSTTLHPGSTCDGKGACVAPADVSCGSFICANNACLTSCKSVAECVPPNTCVNNSCGRLPNGAACTKGDQCSSGFCTEGVCCNSACADGTVNSLCMSCKVSGRVGSCSVVPDGQADPKQRCAASNPAQGNCSNDGTCNGRGGCRPWPTSVGCRAASCTGSTYTPAANCDGAGNCPISMQSKCDPYKCGSSSSCLTTCTSDADCVTGETCLQAAHRCGDKLANGQPCGANSDCSSGICNGEGVCCNAICNQACKSCTLQSHLGTCTDIADGGTPRDTTTCVQGATCGNTGKCNGTGGCQLGAPGLVCGDATCAEGVSGRAVDGSNVTESVARIPAPECDGRGVCESKSPVSCGAYQCAAGQCKTACSGTNADCNSLIPSTANPQGGNSCNTSSSPPTCQKLPNGSACGVKEACQNGNCVDGTCCESTTCDDGLACTADSCATSDGKCSHTIAIDSCVIQNVCYAAGAVNPSHGCQVCDPGTSRTNWSPRSAGSVCRPKAGDCDVAEVCDGTGIDCPAEVLLPSSTTCRAAAGDCDVEEKCDGTHAACPADQAAPSSKVCRARATDGVCDVEETCDGTTKVCPVDGYLTDRTNPCRAADPARKCQAPAYCNGAGPTCPANPVIAEGSECRPANGVCDRAEVCDGQGADCPADVYRTDLTTPCRAADPAHACQGPAYCNGGGPSCPANPVLGAGATCRGVQGPCDRAEICDGTSADCPTDVFQAVGYACRESLGACDDPTCGGTSAACPTDKFLGPTHLCQAAPNPCQLDAYCSGSAVACPSNPPKVCPTTTVCHTPTCNEANGDCSETNRCLPGQICNSNGTCSDPPPPPPGP